MMDIHSPASEVQPATLEFLDAEELLVAAMLQGNESQNSVNCNISANFQNATPKLTMTSVNETSKSES